MNFIHGFVSTVNSVEAGKATGVLFTLFASVFSIGIAVAIIFVIGDKLWGPK